MHPAWQPQRCTRRAFLLAPALVRAGFASPKGTTLPSSSRAYADPSTELPVVRLSDPQFPTFLPASYGRFLARSNGFLLCWSSRAGSPQAYRLDQKNGEMLQLTEAAALDGSSVTLIPGDRSFCYFDGDSLRLAAFSNLRDREVCHLREGWGRGRGFSVSRDGAFGLFVETKGDSWQIRQNWFAKQSAATVLDSRAALSHPIPRPKGDGVLFRREDGSLWVCGSDGQHERSCPRVPGTAGQAFWAPDGKSVLYLHFPEDRSVLNSIREWEPDSGAERLVSKTSQFVQFALNSDASIFAGASTSKASPNILLLHRGTRRELTICEHRASDASRTSPVFSPDSQRLFFQSDRDGKPAIYCMIVDRLVERTEE